MHNIYSLHVFTVSPTYFGATYTIIRENFVPFSQNHIRNE